VSGGSTGGEQRGSGSGPAGTTDSSTSGMPEDATPGSTLPAAPGALQHEVIGTRQGMFGVRDSGDTSGYGGLVRAVTMPTGSEPPYGGWFDEVAQALSSGLEQQGVPDAIERVVVHRGEITFFIRRQRLAETARLLRDAESLRFEMCLGVSGVHYPQDQGRELHAVYHLLSMTHNRRIRLEVTCPEDDPHIPSVVATYPTNDWHERETYDFFGILFDGHPSLTRIEMPDDWPGHPQRKDYPLGGIPVEYKGATIPPPDDRRSYN
jgi:NADH-quinone oxidoreductase subunit C